MCIRDRYYDDVLILLKTGLRISELCGLTIMDVDFIHEVVVIDHQLLKSKEQGYYIETPKTSILPFKSIAIGNSICSSSIFILESISGSL